MCYVATLKATALNTDDFINYAGSLQSSSFAQPLAALDKRRQQLGVRVDF